MNQIKERPEITLQPVTSSQIKAIGFDAKTGILAIQFPDKQSDAGSIYHYDNFTVELFEQFKNAESIGSHFIRNIKNHDDLYPYTRIL